MICIVEDDGMSADRQRGWPQVHVSLGTVNRRRVSD